MIMNKLLLFSVFSILTLNVMQVGRKRGQRSIWQKEYGLKILLVRMPKQLSSVR